MRLVYILLVLFFAASCDGGPGNDPDNSVYNDSPTVDSDTLATETSQVCGNNIAETGEACDGTDLNGYTAMSLMPGYIDGALSCKADCSGYTVTDAQPGRTYIINSCEEDIVQAAIDDADNGDTVILPAGTCTWETIEGPSVILNKGIVLQGAGVDQTVIIDDTGTGWNENALWIDIDKPYTWRVTGISFIDTLSETVSDTVINIDGNCDSWRIDHLKFSELNKFAIMSRSYSPGVIDHCMFEDQYRSTLYFRSFDSGEDSPDALWSRPTELGTKEAIYIEDNVYTVSGENHPAADGEYGLSWVFRHNTLTNFWLLAHGYESNRSAIKMEVYDNTFIVEDDTDIFRVINYRGGTGVAFNNTVEGEPDYFIGVMYYCGCPEQTGASCRLDLGQQECTGYPCLDQPGRTYNQNLLPIFQWNNDWAGGSTDFYVHDIFDPCPVYNSDIMVENRDFYNDAVTPDPATGSYSASYIDDSGNTRQWYYKPYPYPHPLVQLGDSF